MRLVAVLLVMMSGIAFAQDAAKPAGLEQEIRRLDQMEADAVLRGDYAKLDALWARDFTVNSPFNEVSTGTRGRVRTGAIVYSCLDGAWRMAARHANVIP